MSGCQPWYMFFRLEFPYASLRREHSQIAFASPSFDKVGVRLPRVKLEVGRMSQHWLATNPKQPYTFDKLFRESAWFHTAHLQESDGVWRFFDGHNPGYLADVAAVESESELRQNIGGIGAPYRAFIIHALTLKQV